MMATPASAAAAALAVASVAAATRPEAKRRAAASECGATAKPRKKKKRTYNRRKEEIEALMAEMAHLRKQMQYFELRAQVLHDREEILRREETNKELRDAMHAQRLSFASAISLMSQFFRDKKTAPFDSPIWLVKDPAERHAQLLRMKKDRLRNAYKFMLERQRFMDTTAEFRDQKRFETPNGDLCSQCFQVTPLPGARGVKPIVDALDNFVFNIEINLSEILGDITVRENDDPTRKSSVAQHRLVTNINDEVRIDTNNVSFAEYRPAGPPGSGVGEMGFSICDSADEDEMFPYQPTERVRQDMTVISMVAWHQREDGEPVVVVTRWYCLRIRHSEIYMSPFAAERLRSGIDKVHAAMLETARRASMAA